MKSKFKKDLKKPTLDQLARHVQDITDDLSTALTGGLSFIDNLNSDIKTVKVTSGKPFELSEGAGAVPIFTAGATITNYSFTRNNRKVLIGTVTMKEVTADITFLIVGG